MKILFIMLCASLSADISDYFKKIDHKSAVYFNQVQNIDFIYTINLDQRPKKWEHCVAELAPYGIYPYRFSAVNGWELTLEDINALGVKYKEGMAKNLWGTAYLDDHFGGHHEIMHVIDRAYFCHCMSRGAIGIALSHLSILQDAYDSGYQTIWVMEDDIEVIQNPHHLSSLISTLDVLTKGHWDILFTDRDTKDQTGQYIPCTCYGKRPDYSPKNRFKCILKAPVTQEFRKIAARYGAYSMIIRRSGMKKLLQFFKTYGIFLPYDIDFSLPNDMHMYTVINDVVSTEPCAVSDNGHANYKFQKD